LCFGGHKKSRVYETLNHDNFIMTGHYCTLTNFVMLDLS
jgi:hypothetical protein